MAGNAPLSSQPVLSLQAVINCRTGQLSWAQEHLVHTGPETQRAAGMISDGALG